MINNGNNYIFFLNERINLQSLTVSFSMCKRTDDRVGASETDGRVRSTAFWGNVYFHPDNIAMKTRRCLPAFSFVHKNNAASFHLVR